MKDLINNTEIEILCENCGRKTKKTIRWIKNHSEFTCSCDTQIVLDAKQFNRQIAEMERSVADLERTLKKFSK